jgi:lipoate-protein ligase A
VASYDNHLNKFFKQVDIIPLISLSGSMNMAIDHTLSGKSEESCIPIIRFYGWQPYCVSIGYHQKAKLLDSGKLKRDKVDVVRRPTGGRAIFHADELTYSIVCSRKQIHHKNLYSFIHQLFADSLQSLGYPVDLKTDNEKLGGLTHKPQDFHCFTKSAQTEIQIGRKKVMGSAQKIYDNSILQHGSLLIGKKHQQLTEYLNIPHSEKKKIEMEVMGKTICLSELKKEPISREKIIESIINQLELVRGISVNSRSLTAEELKAATAYEIQFSDQEFSK